MKTVVPKADQIQQDWYLIDASNVVLGRLATQVASILRGKNKPYFAPHLDTGDYIVIINAEKIRLTGNKELQKYYKRYSGYPSGQKEIPYLRMLEEKPEEIIIHAVKGMLPKNALGRKLLQKLKVYSGNTHPHLAQKPKEYILKYQENK
jgi:large subunit ribosomal protein L13